MSRAHAYRPRFVDIRIRPPGKEAESEVARCDWADCVAPGECRAPKGPDRLRDYYWFCPRHAAEYNRSWNFFAEMSDDQIKAWQRADATGHRPTWSMRSDMGDRMRHWSKARRGQAGGPGSDKAGREGGFEDAFADARAYRGGFFDAFDLFGADFDPRSAHARRRERMHAPEMGKLEARAYETLGFHGRATADEVRTRYAELVKRFHPDVNGGDRSTEERLQQVIHAYKTLRKAGVA